MVNVLDSQHLMLDRQGRWNSLLLQYVNSKSNDILAVLVAEKCYISNQSRAGSPQFHAAFHTTAQGHSRAILRPPGLLKSIQGAKSTGIIRGAYESSPGVAPPQVCADKFER